MNFLDKCLTGTLAAILTVQPLNSFAADHGDAPAVRKHDNLDINDVYLFKSPVNSANVVMIMTVSPVAGIVGPLTFENKGAYEFAVDNDGDAKPDVLFTAKFGGAAADGSQQVNLFQSNGKGKSKRKIASGATSTDISVTGGGTFRAALIDDPFFFDLLSFRNSLNFCTGSARNFFLGLNTLALILEIPVSEVQKGNSSEFGVWARTFENDNQGKKGRTKQFDRMGRPVINTVLVTSANKDKFNKDSPLTDRAKYQADGITIMQALGNSLSGAQTVADILFPDILTIDFSSSSGFPNGRKLTDDVIDTSLQLVTGNGAATDCVSSDSSFVSVFPYVAAKNP